MFCPQCGHQQISDDTRFCSRCGLSLGHVTGLLINSGSLQREKREISGVGLMMATVLMLLNFIIVFGAVALPHLANPVFLWTWIAFVIGSLTMGGFGLANLIQIERGVQRRANRLERTGISAPLIDNFQQDAVVARPLKRGVRSLSNLS